MCVQSKIRAWVSTEQGTFSSEIKYTGLSAFYNYTNTALPYPLYEDEGYILTLDKVSKVNCIKDEYCFDKLCNEIKKFDSFSSCTLTEVG